MIQETLEYVSLAMFRVVSVDQKDANDSLSCCYLLNKFENFHIKGANNTFIVSK